MLGPFAMLALVPFGILPFIDLPESPRSRPATRDEAVVRLAGEVRTKGWIVFSARSADGDWDLFVCRPDGTDVRNLTRTPMFNEAAPQFSRDGRQLLYRRLARAETISGNQYGTQGELVFARADGTSARAFGHSGEYLWASWGPDSRQVACLSIKGISFVDIASQQAVRTLPRKGFFQQMTWSPDGKWLCGVANSFGTSWAVARMRVDTGVADAVSRVDCCTPDWFPDSRRLIFSNRPPGQRENHGNGWTQLWMSDADGTSRRLVYGEDGRHVYGGCISPDGKYVLFTGNMQEDGDPGHAGAPMGLLRLAHAPIIGGASLELRRLHGQVKSGPVLPLPAGWEPCWAFAEISADEAASASSQPPRQEALKATIGQDATTARQDRTDDGANALAREVRGKGWIACSARTDAGDWDLFVMRPDGSARRALVSSRDYHEAGVRFSPDGRKLLYYRIPRDQAIDNNTYGTFELAIADADGRNVTVLGRDFPWASWGPDSTRLAILRKEGIAIVDISSRRVVQQLPRRKIVQQLVFSPDGKALAGTANGLGPYWNIGCLDVATEQIRAVSETERYNCTPDWMPDSLRILYSRGIIPETGGWAEVWMARSDGTDRRLLCAEENRHLYGGCASPDGAYLLFTRSEADLGPVENSRTSLAIIRLSDTPMIRGDVAKARESYASARPGPVLGLSWGWEPHWTYSEVPGE
jgi:Tol biopolymer transport system component